VGKKEVFTYIMYLLLLFGSYYLYYQIGYKIGHNEGYIMADTKLINLHEKYNELSKNTSCGNIQEYVSEQGFIYDYYQLRNKTDNCYNPENGTNSKLYNVDWLDNCSDIYIDCEDTSFMIDCLAREYNIDCEYYTYLATGAVKSHRGIECNVTGEFERLN